MPTTLLKGITWQNPRGYDPLIAATQEWILNSHSGVVVQWFQYPWYRFERLVLDPQGDNFDLVMFDHPWTGTLVDRSLLIPFDTLTDHSYLCDLRSRVVSPSMESYERDGHLWALPVDASCHAALYRADLVGSEALPSTWEDVLELAKSIHNPPFRYGLVLSLEGVLGHCLFLLLMASTGQPVYTDPQRSTFNREAAEYALTTIANLIQYVPPGSAHWGPWDIYERLTSADDVCYSPSIFAYVNYFGAEGRRGELRLGTVPSFQGRGPARPIVGGVGLGISRSCKLPLEAAGLAMHIMSDGAQEGIIPANHGQPATRSAWTNARLNESTNNFYFALAENMASGYVRPTYRGFHERELRGGRILQRYWDREATLSETLTELAAG